MNPPEGYRDQDCCKNCIHCEHDYEWGYCTLVVPDATMQEWPRFRDLSQDEQAWIISTKAEHYTLKYETRGLLKLIQEHYDFGQDCREEEYGRQAEVAYSGWCPQHQREE